MDRRGPLILLLFLALIAGGSSLAFAGSTIDTGNASKITTSPQASSSPQATATATCTYITLGGGNGINECTTPPPKGSGSANSNPAFQPWVLGGAGDTIVKVIAKPFTEINNVFTFKAFLPKLTERVVFVAKMIFTVMFFLGLVDFYKEISNEQNLTLWGLAKTAGAKVFAIGGFLFILLFFAGGGNGHQPLGVGLPGIAMRFINYLMPAGYSLFNQVSQSVSGTHQQITDPTGFTTTFELGFIGTINSARVAFEIPAHMGWSFPIVGGAVNLAVGIFLALFVGTIVGVATLVLLVQLLVLDLNCGLALTISIFLLGFYGKESTKQYAQQFISSFWNLLLTSLAVALSITITLIMQQVLYNEIFTILGKITGWNSIGNLFIILFFELFANILVLLIAVFGPSAFLKVFTGSGGGFSIGEVLASAGMGAAAMTGMGMLAGKLAKAGLSEMNKQLGKGAAKIGEALAGTKGADQIGAPDDETSSSGDREGASSAASVADGEQALAQGGKAAQKSGSSDEAKTLTSMIAAKMGDSKFGAGLKGLKEKSAALGAAASKFAAGMSESNLGKAVKETGGAALGTGAAILAHAAAHHALPNDQRIRSMIGGKGASKRGSGGGSNGKDGGSSGKASSQAAAAALEDAAAGIAGAEIAGAETPVAPPLQPNVPSGARSNGAPARPLTGTAPRSAPSSLISALQTMGGRGGNAKALLLAQQLQQGNLTNLAEATMLVAGGAGISGNALHAAFGGSGAALPQVASQQSAAARSATSAISALAGAKNPTMNTLGAAAAAAFSAGRMGETAMILAQAAAVPGNATTSARMPGIATAARNDASSISGIAAQRLLQAAAVTHPGRSYAPTFSGAINDLTHAGYDEPAEKLQKLYSDFEQNKHAMPKMHANMLSNAFFSAANGIGTSFTPEEAFTHLQTTIEGSGLDAGLSSKLVKGFV